MQLMTRANQMILYKDILTYKYHPCMKPIWHMEPRKLKATRPSPQPQIVALIPESTLPIVHRELFNSSKGSWEAFEDIAVGKSIRSIVQWQHSYLCAHEQGRICCFDMKFTVSMMFSKMPTSRENCALLLHQNSLYVLGGNEYNNKTWKYDIPSKVVEG